MPCVHPVAHHRTAPAQPSPPYGGNKHGRTKATTPTTCRRKQLSNNAPVDEVPSSVHDQHQDARLASSLCRNRGKLPCFQAENLQPRREVSIRRASFSTISNFLLHVLQCGGPTRKISCVAFFLRHTHVQYNTSSPRSTDRLASNSPPPPTGGYTKSF